MRTGASSAEDRSVTGQLLTVKEVSDLLKVGPTFVYRHAADLGGVKVGRHLRFRKGDIDTWLEERRVENPDEAWRSALPDRGSSGRKSLSVPPDSTRAGARDRKRVQEIRR